MIHMSNDFNKTDFIKTTPAPRCASCSARTITQPLKQDLWKCNNCNHLVDEDGVCTSTRRCESCQGRPKCTKCGKITESYVSEELDTQFRCENCDHRVSDEGDCEENSCSTCNPYSCNNCGSTLYGELDSDDEIHCDNCDHYVNSDGDCTSSSCSTCNPYSCNNCGSTLYGELDIDDEIHCDNCDHYVNSDGECNSRNRGHCDTCDTFPDCPACGANTYHEHSDEEGDTGNYYCKGDCHHTLDYHGSCLSNPCNNCGKSCTSCGADVICNNGPSCSYEREGNCQFCHCHDDYLPDCPNCGDNGDVEGPDGDGDFHCTYSDCNSENYFS